MPSRSAHRLSTLDETARNSKFDRFSLPPGEAPRLSFIQKFTRKLYRRSSQLSPEDELQLQNSNPLIDRYDMTPVWSLENFLSSDYYDPIESLPENIVKLILSYMKGADFVQMLNAYQFSKNFQDFVPILGVKYNLRIADKDLWPTLRIREDIDIDGVFQISGISKFYERVVFFGVNNMGFINACKLKSKSVFLS